MYSLKGSVSHMTGAYKRCSKRADGSHIWALMSLEALGTEDVRQRLLGARRCLHFSLMPLKNTIASFSPA